MDCGAIVRDQDRRSSVQAGEYTAVLFYHGMGEQKRYQEISRLINGLDRFGTPKQPGGAKVNIFDNFETLLETHRLDPERVLSYVQVELNKTAADDKSKKERFRFYEMYWAPLTAGQCTVRGVLLWIFRQLKTPFVIMKEPWVFRQRFKRSILTRMWVKKREKAAGAVQKDVDLYYRKLFLLYGMFGSAQVRREKAYKSGHIWTFCKFIKDKCAGDSRVSSGVVRLALRWYAVAAVYEIGTLLVLLLILATVIPFLISGSYFFLFLLKWLDDFGFVDYFRNWPNLARQLVPNYSNASSFALLLLSFFGAARFIKKYLGDVQVWTTYEETEEKHKIRNIILRQGTHLLQHVLGDPACKRVVVMGHSLGSAIANDSMLELGRLCKAAGVSQAIPNCQDVDKIDQFITLGSPIDKIHYFFESHRGKFPRYQRIVDTVRGDLGTIPFTQNKIPHIHWINFWDRDDIISGTLETPNNKDIIDYHIDNVEVSNNTTIPDPVNSHSDYFKNPKVMIPIYDAIFRRKHSYKTLPIEVEKELYFTSEKMHLGPGKAYPLKRLFHLMYFAGIWAFWIFLILVLFN